MSVAPKHLNSALRVKNVGKLINGGVLGPRNLLGCVQPFQCQHPGTHQSLG